MTESVLVSQLQHGIALEFERSDSEPAQRIRLLLSQLLFISSEVQFLFLLDKFVYVDQCFILVMF